MMKRQTVVVIEYITARLAGIGAIAREAARSGLQVVAVVPDTLSESELLELSFTVHTNRDWTTEGLEAAVRRIEAVDEVVGIGSVIGFFTHEGLLGAQVAELCARRGLPHTPIDALWRTNNKFMMRQTLQEHEVYSVRHARVQNEASLQAAAKSVGFPLILKPVVGVGSSFISRCESVEDMHRVFDHYRMHVIEGYYANLFCAHEVHGLYFDPMQEMLAEEAIDGYEVSVECLCTQDQILPLLIHDKLDVEQEAYCSFENLLITPPVRLDAGQQDQVRSYTRDVLNALGLKNCFCHVELRYDSKGRPSVIEVNPWVGGMRVKDSLFTLRGIRHEAVYLQQLLGTRVTFAAHSAPPGYYGMLAIYPRQSGTLREIRGVESARQLHGMLDIATYVAPGSRVGGDYEEVFAVDAWFRGDTPADISALDRQVKSLVKVDVDE